MTDTKSLPSSLKALLLASIVALLVGAAYESMWRARGARPTFPNTEPRWAHARASLHDDDSPNAMALLGASRMQQNVSLDALEQVRPNVRAYQLAWDGLSPPATLDDLAEDEAFVGIAVVSMMPIWLLEEGGRDEQTMLVRYYHSQWTWARSLERFLTDAVSSISVTRDYHYSLQRMYKASFGNARFPTEPNYVWTSIRREQLIDFAHADSEILKKKRIASMQRGVDAIGPLPDEKWNAAVGRMKRSVDRIQARGGRVVFVKMPASDELLAVEREKFPVEKYWNDMATKIDAVFVHTPSMDQFQDFELPDGSHLDAKDRERFSKLLVAVLEEEGVFR